ncbi:uncharacterized protein GLRG_00961 [Colletotrichum graminicola M1.001]|uniref:Uncharacterized protein n=1 Tax=Colletotrichum graminicola (strain M1.001 / M2 / FGSC 10212) TaxID=645133 RepID=E3Q550_COLGM|nr:uncharacterized protein GLRG_00961 [Colletotrichum graminicola M1.001]EFQ25817.1 hypothetical protein GLRG_00961 [Colletotrichum graminicola M1.001]
MNYKSSGGKRKGSQSYGPETSQGLLDLCRYRFVFEKETIPQSIHTPPIRAILFPWLYFCPILGLSFHAINPREDKWRNSQFGQSNCRRSVRLLDSYGR